MKRLLTAVIVAMLAHNVMLCAEDQREGVRLRNAIHKEITYALGLEYRDIIIPRLAHV